VSNHTIWRLDATLRIFIDPGQPTEYRVTRDYPSEAAARDALGLLHGFGLDDFTLAAGITEIGAANKVRLEKAKREWIAAWDAPLPMDTLRSAAIALCGPDSERPQCRSFDAGCNGCRPYPDSGFRA
jgi:hypothetical protein